MNKSILALGLSLSSLGTIASEDVNNHYGATRLFVSNDTDGTSIVSSFIGLSTISSFIPVYSLTYVEAGNYSGTNNGIGGFFDWSDNKISLNGYSLAVRHTESNELFYMGDMNLSYKINKNLDISLGVFGDLVDTEKSLENGIVFKGYSVGFDVYNNHVGLASSVRQAFYSNNNTQNRYDIKGYVSVLDGLSLYISHRFFENNLPLNGMYWSPDEYDRTMIGISFRKRLGEYLVYGYGEGGQGTASYYFENNESYHHDGFLYNWKLNVERKFDNEVSSLLTLGMDMNQDDKYHYRYAILQVTWNF